MKFIVLIYYYEFSSLSIWRMMNLSCDVVISHGIQSHHYMANRWGKMETVTYFIFLGSKITADGDCSHEIQRCLFLGRKAMANLDSVLKSRDITLPTKSV